MLNNIPPKDITADELIQRFASKEKEFKVAREQYTWTQSVRVQTLEGNTVDGEYMQVFDVVFDDRGRRISADKVRAAEYPHPHLHVAGRSRRH